MVTVSSVQQGDSFIFFLYYIIYIYLLFQILFHYWLLQDIEYSSLCYTVGPWLPILYTEKYICQPQTLNLYLPTSIPFSNHKFVLCVCGSISHLYHF